MYRQNEDIQSPRVGFSDIFIHTQARVIIIIIIIFFFGGGGRGQIMNFIIIIFYSFFFFFFFGGGGGVRKTNILLGMKILWIFLGGHHKIGLYKGVVSMHFRVFSQG